MPTVAGWFHCSVKPISRSTGRSVVAAAAYRLGSRMEDHEYGILRDFTRRSGVVTTMTIVPSHGPDWAHNPERLWNAAEAAETRKNSTLAREIELALPASLTDGQREALVRIFAGDLVERYGVAVTAAIHAPGRGDDRNFHCHIMMTTRRMTEDGLGEKTRILDAKATGPKEVAWMREHACDAINAALERAGIDDERVDHRSFKDRGIDRAATKHLGPTAAAIERKGGESDRGNANRAAEDRNRALDALVEEYKALDAEIAAEEERRLYERFGAPEPDRLVTLEEARQQAAEAAKSPDMVMSPEAEEEAQLEADAAAFDAQIRQNGIIEHSGLAVSWWEHGAAIATQVYHQGRELIRNVWHRLLEAGSRGEER